MSNLKSFGKLNDSTINVSIKDNANIICNFKFSAQNARFLKTIFLMTKMGNTTSPEKVATCISEIVAQIFALMGEENVENLMEYKEDKGEELESDELIALFLGAINGTDEDDDEDVLKEGEDNEVEEEKKDKKNTKKGKA